MTVQDVINVIKKAIYPETRRYMQNTVIPFSTQSANILDKKFKPSIYLYSVDLSGNLKNSDETVIVVNQKTPYKLYGLSSLTINQDVTSLKVTANYGAERYGKLVVAYEGIYFSSSSVGTSGMPQNLIDYIEKIAEITTIGTIEEITEIAKIRDLFHRPHELIVNGSFEENWVDWHKYLGNPVIDETDGYFSSKCLKFASGQDEIVMKLFPVAVGVDWLSSLGFWLKATVAGINCLKIEYVYSDGTSSSEYFQVVIKDVWTEQTCSPTAGKKILRFAVWHEASMNVESKVDFFNVVF